MKTEEQINKEILKELFLKYIELQQGLDYIEEQEYNFMSFENIKLFEREHFKDFKEVLK